MKFKALTFSLLFFVLNLAAQEPKFIEVTGSAEMLVEPDEFIFMIGIKEYWKEEFEKGKEFKDYANKIEINKIEQQLIKDLNDLGVKQENIKITEVGNYWRQRGKEFLIGKRLEISLIDFKFINKIVSSLDRKGIEYMRIGELKNKELLNHRKEVKKQALLAAREKATYLLEVMDKEIGDIISITELDNNHYFGRSTSSVSNIVLNSTDDANGENGKKINLRFKIKAKFEIKP